MTLHIKGFGVSASHENVGIGDFIVGKHGSGVQHLAFVTAQTDAEGKPVVAVLNSTASDQAAAAPYLEDLDDYRRNLLRVTEDLYVVPGKGQKPFTPTLDEPDYKPGVLCVGSEDTMVLVAAGKAKAWLSLLTGELRSHNPSHPNFYTNWSLRWRDGEHEEVLVDFNTAGYDITKMV